MTEAMVRRATSLGAEWRDEGDGYWSLRGAFMGPLAYIALPEDHPDVGKEYDDLDPDVNGGLTFSEGNVFGWDYAHYMNPSTPEVDIPNALEYFRSRA